MRTIFSLFLVLAGVAATVQALTVDGVPISQQQWAAAVRVVTTNSPQDALMRGDNVYAQHPFFRQLVAKVDFTKVNQEAAVLLLQTFTDEEIQALDQFQSSPAGKRIAAKMPGYQMLVGSLLQNHLKAAMQGQLTGRDGTAAAPAVPVTPAAVPALTGEGGSSIK